MLEEDRVHTPLIATVGVVSSVVVVTLVLLLGALLDSDLESQVRRRRAAAPPSMTEVVAAEDAARLRGYAWVDRERGVVSIPIDRAMELVLREEARRDAVGREPTGGDL